MSNIRAALCLLYLSLCLITYGAAVYIYKTEEVSAEKYEMVEGLVNDATRSYIAACLQNDGIISRTELHYIITIYKRDRERRSRDAEIVTIHEDLKPSL